MPASAPMALAAAVALSALGAVALCGLVVLYGFTPAGEEPPGRAARRLLITRVGHAFAAACFVATSILITMVLVRPAPGLQPAAAPDAQVEVLDTQVAGQESRLSEAERRLRELENAVQRRLAEPPSPPAPVTVERPATRRPSANPRLPAPSRSAAPATHAGRHADEPSPSLVLASPPVVDRPVPGAVPQTAPPPPPAWVAASPPPTVTSPPPPAAPPPPAVAASPRAAPADAGVSSPRPVPRSGFNLWSKLREDWREIRRGFDSGEDDFRRAVEGTKKKLGLGD
jgi:hypothetical protein